MWLVNHSFGDGPPVQSQTSMPVNSSSDGPRLFTQPPVCAPPCGPPGGVDAFIAAWTGRSRISQDRLGAPEVGTRHVNSGDCACDLEASSCAPPGPGNLVPEEAIYNRTIFKKKKAPRPQNKSEVGTTKSIAIQLPLTA